MPFPGLFDVLQDCTFRAISIQVIRNVHDRKGIFSTKHRLRVGQRKAGVNSRIVEVPKGTSKNYQFSAIPERDSDRTHLFVMCLMSGLAGL